MELVANAMRERRPSGELPNLAKRLAGRSDAMTRIRERVSGLAPLWTPVLTRTCFERRRRESDPA